MRKLFSVLLKIVLMPFCRLKGFWLFEKDYFLPALSVILLQWTRLPSLSELY